MCHAGAKGDTANELKQLLSLNDFKSNEEIHSACSQFLATLKVVSSSGDIALNSANKLFPNNDFELNKDFTDTLQKHFGAGIQQLNYKTDAIKSTETINTWVANETNNKIKDLIPQGTLDELTQLVLVNAIYFKGKWLNKFDEAETQSYDFNLLDGTYVSTPTMVLYNSKFKYNRSPLDGKIKATTCEFPYVGNNVSMLIVLPEKESNINELEAALDGKSVHKLLEESHNSGQIKVSVHIPKFKFEYKIEVLY
jgi:serine protease inhibitor